MPELSHSIIILLLTLYLFASVGMAFGYCMACRKEL